MFDIKIKNGTIVDGTGNPWFVADIGITGERISAIGDLSSVKARRTIDATNKIVSPGFCDLHSHSDYLILANPTAESKVTVGVTADISGNCGGSAAPQNEMFWQEWWTPDVDERFKLVTREYAKNTLAMHGIGFDWHTVKEYLDKVRKTGISINYGQLIGHYTLRIAAYGQERRKPTPEELETMKSLLRQGIMEGAIGFSTEVGSHFIWEYEIDELLELCKTCKEAGGVFSYDIIDYGPRMLHDLEVALWVVEQTGVPAIISHIQVYGRENSGKAKYVLQMIDDTRSRGFNVVADVMANALGGGLFFSARGVDLLPEWCHDNLAEVLDNPETRERLRKELMDGRSSRFYVNPNRTEEERQAGMVYSFGPLKDIHWHHYVTIVRCKDKSLEGKTIYDIMRERGTERFDTLFDVLRKDPDVRTVINNVHPDNMREVVCHPHVAFGTDGGLVGAIKRPQIPNPCLYATFPMVIRKYVREEKVLRLEDCIRKMSSLPMIATKQYDRGVLRPGFKADVVVFDYDEISEVLEYGDTVPTVFAKGIENVIVNGTLVVEEGKHNGQRPGQVLGLNQSAGR